MARTSNHWFSLLLQNLRNSAYKFKTEKSEEKKVGTRTFLADYFFSQLAVSVRVEPLHPLPVLDSNNIILSHGG